MRSSFFEFNVATSGFFVAKGGLQVVSHNIANAETPGYSRQYAELRASTPLTFYDGKGMIGTGGEIYGVSQYRNFYLDTKYWSERSVLGEYGMKRTQLEMVQSSVNTLATSSTTTCIDDFFSTLQQLSTNAADMTFRNNVVKAAQMLTTNITSTAASLKRQQSDINEEVKSVVKTINSLGQQIRSLNEQIYKYELDGSNANDLRDSRARLVDELSLYVNVEVSEVETNEDYAAGKYPEP